MLFLSDIWLKPFNHAKSWFFIALLVCTFILASGCSSLDRLRSLNEPTPKPESQDSPLTLETSTPEPTIEPTQVPIPMGLIRVPITGGARQTAQEINSTDLPAHDLYRTVQEMKGMTTESLVPIISENPELNLSKHTKKELF